VRSLTALDQRLALAPPKPAASPLVVSHRALSAGRATVGALAVFAVFAASDGSSTALAESLVTAAVWVAVWHAVHSSGAVSQAGAGMAMECALAAAIAVAAACAVAPFASGYFDQSGGELLAVAVGLAVFSCAYESLVVGRLGPKRRVLIVGPAKDGIELISELSARSAPFECLGIVDDGSRLGEHVLGGISDLPTIISRDRPDLVVLAKVDGSEAVMHHLFGTAGFGFRVLDIHHFYEHAFGRVPLQNLTQAWFMSLLHLYRRPYSRISKRVLDLVFAIGSLVLFAPLIPLAALLVRCSSAGPVLFKQTRIGEGGRPFQLYKFRTMIAGAELDGNAVWASEHDPRITAVGRVLRRTRLDELPQLWNVLRGDMSMVGPRPERPEFIDLLSREVPYWTRRNLVKPGITGWAQIRCGYTSDAVGAAEKLSYDLYYLKHRGLLLDVAIAARTVAVVVTGSGAH
jgi:exopolysaccharide biosynthesis polyprenyl glycosylphosphotransferase